MSETLPITIHVDADEGITNAPYWVIIDPQKFKQYFKCCLEGEGLDSIDEINNDDVMDCVTNCFRGPFFSRAEAEREFAMTVYCSFFTDAASIYCLSGSSNLQYSRAYNEALDVASDTVVADSGTEA